MPVTQGVLAVAAVLGFLYTLVKVSKVGSRAKGLPPGPPTIPILGNLHLMPTVKPHLQLQKWAQEYGPIYSLILGLKVMIVLSSDVTVKDLLDKRSSIYSDRPDMFIGQKIASGDMRLVVMRYGENWRMIHRIIHNILNIKAAVTYLPYQDLENKFLLAGLLETPDDVLNHIRRYSYSLSTQMIFGYRCPDLKEPRLQQLFWSFERWGELAGSASAQLADLFTIMQKLPAALAPNVRYAAKLHEKEKELYVGHWMQAKRGLEAGTGLVRHHADRTVLCIPIPLTFILALFLQRPFESADNRGIFRRCSEDISGSLLEAGSDTTASILYGFIQALLLWPDVQKKAQEEIDRVVGYDRMPTIDDYAEMSYIRCCIKESLRWMPTVSLGVPHAVVQDDVYNGYVIPKGATVVNNVWSIHMDPKRPPDPRRFNPDRFADDPTTLYQSATGDPKKRDNFVSGAGRRLRQGIHIAERSLFLGMSRMLWAFSVSKALDSKGLPITPDMDDLVGGQDRIIRDAVRECEELLDPKTKQWTKVPPGMAFSTWMPEKIEA